MCAVLGGRGTQLEMDTRDWAMYGARGYYCEKKEHERTVTRTVLFSTGAIACVCVRACVCWNYGGAAASVDVSLEW